MKMKIAYLFILCFCISCNDQQANTSAPNNTKQQETKFNNEATDDANYTTYMAHPSQIQMMWKHNGTIIKTFSNLQSIVVADLLFAMNGGMYTPEYGPVGLYVENGKQLKGITRMNNPDVNFGIQPQGIFLVKKATAAVLTIEEYNNNGVLYATQSAPMLVVDSVINPNLPKGNSRHIRNGVGILPDGKVLMACSKSKVTFLEFANYFKNKGCTNALYLDGAISQTTLDPVERRNETGYGVFIVVRK